MTSQDQSGWDQIEPILDRALDLPRTERADYLKQACGSDLMLRARVERMLAAGEDPDSPLERSLAAIAGPLLLDLDGADPTAIPLGEMIGPWRLVAELGQGGMGEVYRAERADGQFAQTAALKLVRRGREHDPLLIRRFLEERRILATLTHPHIARLLDGGVTAAGLPWFAMEYVPGRPLDRYCDELNLDVPARLALVEQVLGAVAYAHRNLLVHRDLKPSNIFVTDDGEVKLLDFGIAKLLGEESLNDPGLTLAYGRVMTPDYAAPEQVRGEPVTTATDIYALGAVLYQLLTGERAHRFDKRTAAEIERVVCETEPEPPSQAGRLSSDLDTLVLTALQKNPARRYPSAEAMLEDLRRYQTGRPLLARPDSFSYRARKFISRHRLGAGAAVLVALALIGGVVATAWQARVARQEAARADQVKEFLIDLLRQADPDITLGREPTVRQLLDRGTARVDSLLSGEPAVQAELYEVLGNTYAHLQLLAAADTLHRKGLAVVRRLYGPGNPEVLNEAMAVGWGLNDRGEYREADSLLGGSIADYRAAGGAESQALSDALDILATTKKRLDRPVEAESLYRQSLALQIGLTGPADTITASRLSDLASLLSAQNRLAPAESALTAAQEHRRGVLPPLDLKFLAGESNLAMIRMKRGDFADADPRLRGAVSGLEQVERPGGLNLARTLDRLALLESLELHSRAAILTAERAVAMFDTVMGRTHPESFNSRSAMASYQADVGGGTAAEADAAAAYAGLRLKMGDRHDWTLAAGQRLASIQLEAGRQREASATASSVLSAVREKFGRIPATYAGLLGTDAALRARRGDSAGAEAEFREALAALAGGTRVDSAAFPSIVVRDAALLSKLGKRQLAESLLRQAQAFLPAGADSSAVIVGEVRRAQSE
ncbi:MAG: serine/threonine-protein kinase [Gemmatimonadota bacterium]